MSYRQRKSSGGSGDLSNVYFRSQRFATINIGTSGTLTLPTGSTIILDDFGGTVDAVLSTISGGRPDFKATRDSAGNIITTTFDASGNYIFSGVPNSYPLALIYSIRQNGNDFNGTDTSIVGTYQLENQNDLIHPTITDPTNGNKITMQYKNGKFAIIDNQTNEVILGEI